MPTYARGLTIVAVAFGWASALSAQEVPTEEPVAEEETGFSQQGRAPETGAGELGMRQKSDEAVANIEPQRRVESRIENRVQNRLRTRIDRDYDPLANARSPFEAADRRSREASRTKRPD